MTDQQQYQSDSKLPEGWEKRISSSRKIPYYINKFTGESSWEFPSSSTSFSNSSKSNNGRMRAYHILLKHTQSRRPFSWRSPTTPITRTPEEARQHLISLIPILSSITPASARLSRFKALAEEISDCSSAKRGGDLGEFGPGEMQPSFEEAVKMLPLEGMSSEPVNSDSGYHLIYRIM